MTDEKRSDEDRDEAAGLGALARPSAAPAADHDDDDDDDDDDILFLEAGGFDTALEKAIEQTG